MDNLLLRERQSADSLLQERSSCNAKHRTSGKQMPAPHPGQEMNENGVIVVPIAGILQAKSCATVP